MISTNAKYLVMFGLAIVSACSDGDDGDAGGVDGSRADAAGRAVSDGGLADVRAADAVSASGGSGGTAGGTGGVGGGGTGSALFKTSVPGTRQADKLTPAELTQICKDLSASGDAVDKLLKPKTCKLAGVVAYLLTDQTQATCDDTVKSCLAKASDENEMCQAIMNCTATVAEVIACNNDQVYAVAAFLDTYPTCAQLASGTTPPEGTDGPQTPASCKVVEAKCPSLTMPGM